MGENICKRYDQSGVNIQSLQATYTAHYQKNKQPNKKMGRRSK